MSNKAGALHKQRLAFAYFRNLEQGFNVCLFFRNSKDQYENNIKINNMHNTVLLKI